MKWLKKFFIILSIGFLFFLGVIFSCNYLVINSAKGKTFNRVEDLPYNKVGLLLGTSKYLKGGGINPYYQYRIEAAVELFFADKIDYILVSGDNGHKSYNEPEEFKKSLIKKGIPEDRIILDYAGFRTLDSVVRAKEIFGQDSFTIISQKFHNERAIYLCENKGIDAVGYNAKDLSDFLGLKVQIREYLARTKAFIDLRFGVQPKFLGEKISIPNAK